jgi:serine/threonine-protein phosphatase 4 regulatory subunit 1
VRKTLSWSLHEIAAILGTKLSENHLLPTFDLFLKDLDEVRIGVITSICKFLRVLSPESRIRHIDTLRDIQREPDQNWRFREVLANQLGELPDLFPSNVLALEIVPIMVGLVRDRIATVRQIAVQKVGQFINTLESDPLFIDLLQELHSLGISSTYKERQLYIKICEGIAPVVSEQRFTSDFLPLMASLARDKVSNVRIVLSLALGSLMKRISKQKRKLFDHRLICFFQVISKRTRKFILRFSY